MCVMKRHIAWRQRGVDHANEIILEDALVLRFLIDRNARRLISRLNEQCHA